MFKGFINKYIKATLNELFTDAATDSLHLSLMGADMFSDSNMHLKNLTFRPDIFDAHFHPLKLVYGHLGLLSIEGIAELAFGGAIKISVEEVYLLFAVDQVIDPEYLQYLKKIAIELQTAHIQYTLFRELFKRAQGFSGAKDPDFKKQRLLALKFIGYLFKSLQVYVRSVHVRIETPRTGSRASPLYCSALGITVPQARFAPASSATVRPDGVGRDEPVLSVGVKNLQVYCDYDCETYLSNGTSPASILHQFEARWKHEVHTAMVLPFDLEIAAAASIHKRTGLVTPRLVISVPRLRLASDHRQLEVIRQLYELYVLSLKRCQHLVTLRATYGRDGPPRLVLTGGSHILPTLAPEPYHHPPAAAPDSRIVALLKARVGVRWKKALWKHFIRVVLHDVRMARPLGRWVALVRLAAVRREYAFIYSTLLKRSARSGNFVFNVNARVELITVKRLFDLEMGLSVAAVCQFRALGASIALVESFNSKRQQARAGRTSGGPQPFERVALRWRDILALHIELVEMQREVSLRRSARNSMHGQQDEDEDWDDGASVRSQSVAARKSEESGGGGSSSLFASGVKQLSSVGSGGLNAVSSAASTAASSAIKLVPTAGTAAKYIPSFILPAPGATSSHGVAGLSVRDRPASSSSGGAGGGGGIMRAISGLASTSTHGSSSSSTHGGGAGTGANSSQFDDFDTKVFGRKEMNAFGDFLGTLETEEKHSDEVSRSSPPVDTTRRTVFDWGLPGESPSLAAVREAVRYTLVRYQQPLTLFPPEISLRLAALELTLRRPLEQGVRHSLAVLSATQCCASITISDSNSSGASGSGAGGSSVKDAGDLSSPYLTLRTIQGLASLAGSLVQLRLTVQALQLQVHVYNTELLAALRGSVILTLESIALQSNRTPAAAAAESGGKVRSSSYPDRSEVEGSDEEEDPDEKFVIPGYEPTEVETPVPISNAGARAVGGPLAVAVVDLFRSVAESGSGSSTQQFLTACLMLDFDDASEGAADLQVAVGAARADFAAELIAFVLDDVTKFNFTRVRSALEDMKYLGRVSSEAALLIDPYTKLPYVETFLFDIEPARAVARARDAQKSHALAPNTASLTDGPADPFACDSSRDGAEADEELLQNHLFGEEGSDHDTQSAATSLPATSLATSLPPASLPASTVPGVNAAGAEARLKYRRMVKAKRLVRREYINYAYWRTALRASLPRAFSVCVRTAAITVDSVACLTVERLLQAESQKLSDRASLSETRQQASALAGGRTYFGLNLVRRSYAGLLAQALQELRLDPLSGHGTRAESSRTRSRRRETSSPGDRLQVDLPPLELVVIKRASPQELFIRLFSVEMKMPIAQETLYDLAALGLKRHVPHYK